MEIHQIANTIPSMSEEEYQLLKQDIKKNGLIEPIIVFENKILDGRNRYRACQELGIKPKFKEYAENDPADYAISLNIKRRHLSPSQLACMAVDFLPFFKESAKERQLRKSVTQKIGEQKKGEATEKTAAIIGSNAEYIRQAEKLQKEDLEMFEKVKNNKISLFEVCKEKKREKTKKMIKTLQSKGVNLPKGKYACLVVDPPWPMRKIERKVRPNQIEFNYPTMNEEELKEFGNIINRLADKNCHLYLWTTHKFLPMALRLAQYWGFNYQCLMTWVKNVGFTPFSWMYSTEHVLFCAKGNLPLLKKGERLDFNANVREHSRKPDEFYQKVKLVSPGPRIDIFSREKRENFDQYGNETTKFK